MGGLPSPATTYATQNSNGAGRIPDPGPKPVGPSALPHRRLPSIDTLTLGPL